MLGLAEQLGDNTGIADALYNIGYVLHRPGENAQALEYLQKSLALRETLGDKTRLADLLNVIGSVYKQQKNYERAVEHYQKSLTQHQATGDNVVELSHCWRGLAVAGLCGGVNVDPTLTLEFSPGAKN